jgi:conjugal transfer pilus assembly protein TraW
MSRAFSRKLLPCVIAAMAATSFAHANDTSIADIAREARAIQANPTAYTGDFEIRPPSDEVVKLAQEITGMSQEKGLRNMPAAASAYGIEMDDPMQPEIMTGDWIDILVSRSLGEAELKQVIASAAHSNLPVRFVFRGIAEGQRINDAMLDYGRWSRGLDVPPQAILDPTIFQDRGVDSVPAMYFMRDGEVVASVNGLTNPEWLARAVEGGETGHLGTRGPVLDIAERDLIELMQERTAQLDLESRKKETIDTYWQRADFIPLMAATENERKVIDPSFVLNEDIRGANDALIVQAGTVINPLQLRPFTLRLIIFNPTREAEVEWAASLESAPGLDDMFIATEIDRDAGWEGFESLEDRLDEPVYLLQPDLRSRFQLQKTPSLVTSESYRFVVEEVAVKDRVSQTQYKADVTDDAAEKATAQPMETTK